MEAFYNKLLAAKINHTAWFRIRNCVPTITWRTSSLDRIDNTLDVLREMYRDYDDLPKNADFFLFADDIPPENIHPLFAYCSKEGSKIFTIQYGVTHIFGSLPPMRMCDWARHWEENGLPFQKRQDCMYWIGGRSPYREHMVPKISHIPNLRAEFSHYPYKFVPLLEQGVYKYLLDMQGLGWSARLMSYFWMGTIVFILDRESHEFWFKDNFKPWVHYVPVRHDGEDLQEAFEKVQAMPDKGEHIAICCRAKAREILTEKYMTNHFADMLRKHVAMYGYMQGV